MSLFIMAVMVGATMWILKGQGFDALLMASICSIQNACAGVDCQ